MARTDADLKQAFQDARGLFIALGDGYRQDILLILGENHQVPVKELAARVGLSRPATSHHLKVLKDAGLLGERNVGVRTYYYPVVHEPFRLVKRLVELVEASDSLMDGQHHTPTESEE